MVLWQGILIVLCCFAVGLLVGLGLLRVLRRKKEKEYSLSNKETATLRTKDAEVPVATTVNNTLTKSNGHEDPLEILLKNHKNGLTVEKPKPPITAVNPASVEVVNQKTEPVIKKEEKPTPHVMHWQELVTPGNPLMQDEYEKTRELPVVKEPVTVNQTSILLAAEPAKAAALSILEEPAIIDQTTTPVKEKPKKAAKTPAPEKPETTTQKHPPAVKDKKKDTKPPAPESVIIKHEKDQKSPEPPQVQESANIEQPVTPVPGKQADVLKTDLIIEIEDNLAIAGRPISDKMVSFQTKCWDSKHGESDSFLNTHYQDLIQLYVDIGLANNIVWLATEINHRSKELDESYVRLCAGIVENIKKVLA